MAAGVGVGCSQMFAEHMECGGHCRLLEELKTIGTGGILPESGE